MSTPLVSAIVPTRHRPHLLRRALRSILGQTLTDLEVIVVLDGPDPATEAVLAGEPDRRLRVLALPEHVGKARASNAAVAAARGRWLALLDDDDEWLPRKLEHQVTTAEQTASPHVIVSCHFLVQAPAGDFLWPRRLPAAGEPLGDYLLARNSPFTGEGMVQTLTLLADRPLMQAIPFDPRWRRHIDTDWLLRAAAVDGTTVRFVPQTEPLAVWHMEATGNHIGSSLDWRHSLDWVESHRRGLSPRAYSSFLLNQVAAIAARSGDWRALPLLLRRAFTAGRPHPLLVAGSLARFLLPQSATGLAAGLNERFRGGRG